MELELELKLELKLDDQLLEILEITKMASANTNTTRV